MSEPMKPCEVWCGGETVPNYNNVSHFWGVKAGGRGGAWFCSDLCSLNGRPLNPRIRSGTDAQEHPFPPGVSYSGPPTPPVIVRREVPTPPLDIWADVLRRRGAAFTADQPLPGERLERPQHYPAVDEWDCLEDA